MSLVSLSLPASRDFKGLYRRRQHQCSHVRPNTFYNWKINQETKKMKGEVKKIEEKGVKKENANQQEEENSNMLRGRRRGVFY